MNDDDIAEASEQIQDLREDVREDLGADLGGDPEDYRAETYFQSRTMDSDEAVPDGGPAKDDEE